MMTAPGAAKRGGDDERPAKRWHIEPRMHPKHGPPPHPPSNFHSQTREASQSGTTARLSRLRCALHILSVWVGFSEAIGFRAPPTARALEMQESRWEIPQSIWRTSDAKRLSPEELLSAAMPLEPRFKLSSTRATRHEDYSIGHPGTERPTTLGNEPSDLERTSGWQIPQQREASDAANPETRNQVFEFSAKSAAHASEFSRVQERGLFREATIRPAPSAAIANPALSEIARYSDARRSGPLTYILRLTQSTILDSNVNASELNRRRDLQISVGPALLTQLGNEETKWRLGGVYVGAFNDFVNRSAQRTFDHIGSLSINSNSNRIRFSLQTSAQKLTSSFPDVGERVTRTTLYGVGTMVCKWGEKLSSELNADFTESSFDRFLSSKEYRVQSLHLYQFSAKTRIGLGTAIGVLSPSIGFEQRYTQGLTRIEYQPTEKLQFNALCGMERREFVETNTHKINPVWLTSVSWAITPKTALSLNIGRRAFASASLAFQNYTVSTTSLSLSHQLTNSLSASITGQHETSKYTSASSGVRTGRLDHYFLGRIELAWAIKRWLSAGSFLEFSENHSEGEGAQPFSRTRAGLSLNLSF